MATADQINNDLVIVGNLTVTKSIGGNNANISDAMIGANAGIQATKLQHQYTQAYSQPGASNAAVERKIVHVVKGTTATLLEFKVGARVAGTSTATVTWDLQVNGTTVLSGTVSLTSATAAYVLLPGTISTPAMVAGNIVEVVVSAVSAGAGALAQGIFAYVTLKEDPV